MTTAETPKADWARRIGLDHTTWEKLEAIAESEDRPIAWLIRRALLAYLAQEESATA